MKIKRIINKEEQETYDFRFSEALQKLPKYKKSQSCFVALVTEWLRTQKNINLSNWQMKNARYGKARNYLVLEALEAIAFRHEVMDKIIIRQHRI
jgi:hypothetical protein